ncbi:MAG TPA: DUF2911 domain-containing protein [Longimicrobiales bacterium]|nr:DUF2911 domain-containing protein [Longimicrobiales bacterium]
MHTTKMARAGVLGFLVLGACANAQPGSEAPDGSTAGQVVTEATVAMECQPSPRMPVEGRASPYDSATVQVGDQALKVCYGRPSARDREIFGGLVPLGQLWRTGANEPTILHVPFTAEIAGIRVDPGSYSMYTEPGEVEWVVIVNRATDQWGHESSYTDEVRAQEVGRGTAPTERLDQHMEQFTIRGEETAAGADLLLEWERTRVRIPVRVVATGG